MNSEVPKPPSQLCFLTAVNHNFFLLQSQVMNPETQIHKTDQNPAITNHKP